MARVAINAMSLRKGGGLQVMAGLLARFSDRHVFQVLWTDPQSLDILQRIVGDRPNITYVNPSNQKSNFAIFAWGMVVQKYWLKGHAIDCVLGVNHYFPSGAVPQIIYHLNILRFQRPKRSLLDPREIADRLRDWRANVALKQAASNVFESRVLLEAARAVTGAIRNPRVIYIGLDEQQRIERSIVAESSAILAVTSTAAHKDNATMVRMLAKLVEMDASVPWTLQIAGGSGREAFSSEVALAQELGVLGRIRFLGFLSHDELSALASKSLCLVSTSLAESFCMVALEAMSWGCPAVVANISSMPESVGAAGLLAKPSDADDFADKVLLLRDAQRRHKFVEAGLKRAASMTWTAAARQVEDEIERVTRVVSE